MKRVINCSSHYNLATEKIERWLNGRWLSEGTLYLSALFTWDLPELVKVARCYSNDVWHIEIGGPAASLMPDYIKEQTGIPPHIGLDERFDQQPGLYFYAFTHRGCPHKCAYCAVSKVEPDFFEYENFEVANLIGDNNILACSKRHQEKVAEKILQSGMEFVDFNSGFDANFFEQWHFDLYSKLPLKVWRFAFDRLDQEKDLRRAIQILRDNGVYGRHKVTVYCLVNYKDTPEEAKYRAETIYQLNALPFIMVFRPLDTLSKKRWINEHWNRRQLADFAAGWNQAKYWRK